MKKIKFLLLGILMIFFQQNLLAQQDIDLNSPIPNDPDVYYGKLDNGITYYVKHNPEPKNRASLMLVVNAGSVLENDDQQGLAHFCEHMAFNGTKHFPKHRLIQFLESIGMKFGADLNAYTSFDETVYTIEVPLDTFANLDTGLMILYDWAHNVSYETEEIEKERGVIHEEWRLGRGAQDRLMRKTFPVMLYGSKYAKRIPIGKPEIFDKCPPDKLRNFYKDWYRPDLEAVIVVGDFDAKKVTNDVKKLFSQIPKRTKERPRIYPPIPGHKDIKVKVATDKETPYSMIEILYKLPMDKTVTLKDYKEDLAKSLFNEMINQRLQEKTVKPDCPYSMAFSFYSHLLGKRDAYMSYVIAKNEKISDALKVALEENERVKRYGFTKTELDRAKKSILKQVEKQYKERNKTKDNYFVAQYHQNFGITKEPFPSIEYAYNITQKMLPDIKLEDVNKFANQWIIDSNMVVIVTAPEKEGVKVPKEEEILKLIDEVKKEKLEPYKDKAVNKPLISEKITPGKIVKKAKDKKVGTQTFILSNGIKVIIKPTDFKDDEIRMTAFSNGGYSLYPLEDNVSARVADEVILESGVGDFDKVQLTKYMSDKNAHVTPYIGLNFEGMDGSSSVDDFETMLQLTYLYFTHPRYDKEAYQAYMAKTKDYLKNKSNDPQSVWGDSIASALQSRCKYTQPLNLELLNKVDYKKVHKIYRERFEDPASFTFIFTGNVDIKKVKPLIEKYLGGLPADKKDEHFKNVGAVLPVGKVEKVIAKKGTENKSMDYMVYTGKLDEYNLENDILLKAVSEILTNRLLDSIREEKALTYSISANSSIRLFPEKQYGIYIFYSCAPDTVDYITKEIEKIVNSIKDVKNISDADFKKTIEKLLKENEIKMRDNKFWLRKLETYEKLNSSPDVILKYDDIVKSLTKEKIAEAAKKYLNNNSYVLISLQPEKK